MNMILGPSRYDWLARACTSLIVVALIVGMVGCGPTPPVKYSLTMVVAPSGSGNATDLTNASPYAAGTVVHIKAVAGVGCQFMNWTAPAGTFANASVTQTTFIMPAQNVTVTANFAPFPGGSGTEDDPYWIEDWYDLSEIRNYLDSSFILVNDLRAGTAGYEEVAGPTANGGKGWQPIGSLGNGLTGTFDGQGYQIRDLFINRPDEDNVGLFSYIWTGSIIKYVGVLNITVTGNVHVGGLLGWNEGTVTNSHATGNVTGGWHVGGLVGVNTGNVSASYSSTYVTGAEQCLGGLIGDNGGTVSYSYSTGNLTTGKSEVGGLMGRNTGTVSNSYSTCSVTGLVNVGGLVGVGEYGGTVSNSYSTGSVAGNSYVGGLVGNGYDAPVNNSFWDVETSGQASSFGGTGKNTTEMQDIITFSDATWNITTVANPSIRNLAYIWNIVDHVTYPFLSWQPV